MSPVKPRILIVAGLLAIGAGLGSFLLLRGAFFATSNRSPEQALLANRNSSSEEAFAPYRSVGNDKGADLVVKSVEPERGSKSTPALRAVAVRHASPPLETYYEHIDRAKAGNARSQYRVAQALQQCRTAPKSEARLNASIGSGLLNEQQIVELRHHYKECAEFPRLVPNMDAEITKWLHEAAEGGDPLAKSYEALLSYANFDIDELKSLVGEALLTGEPEAFSHAVMYYANVTTDNAELYEAWLLISCEWERDCDVANERDRIKRQYRMHERLQIASVESDLRAKLQAREWDQLGF